MRTRRGEKCVFAFCKVLPRNTAEGVLNLLQLSRLSKFPRLQCTMSYEIAVHRLFTLQFCKTCSHEMQHQSEKQFSNFICFHVMCLSLRLTTDAGRIRAKLAPLYCFCKFIPLEFWLSFLLHSPRPPSSTRHLGLSELQD